MHSFSIPRPFGTSENYERSVFCKAKNISLSNTCPLFQCLLRKHHKQTQRQSKEWLRGQKRLRCLQNVKVGLEEPGKQMVTIWDGHRLNNPFSC